VKHDPAVDAWIDEQSGVLGDYVNAFTAHVSVGFFRGAELSDPRRLLQGTGKLMRHVKVGPGHRVDDKALTQLIETAYTDMKQRLETK
jgi:hypothetical protein